MSRRQYRPAALYALPLAVLAIMGGLVLAANPGRYGVAAIAIGSLTTLVGMAVAVRLFRAAEAGKTGESPGLGADPAPPHETEGEVEV